MVVDGELLSSVLLVVDPKTVWSASSATVGDVDKFTKGGFSRRFFADISYCLICNASHENSENYALSDFKSVIAIETRNLKHLERRNSNSSLVVYLRSDRPFQNNTIQKPTGYSPPRTFYFYTPL